MKLRSFIICGITALLIFSCSDTAHSDPSFDTTKTQENPNADPDIVLKDAGTWYNYNARNIKLAENYTPLDTSSKVISRETFLQFLGTGEYVAFRLTTVDSSLKYKLYKLAPDVDKGITALAKQFGKDQYKWYEMEGKEIPDFNFTDLNGKVYNRETTKGKIVILKCWFIHCQACVEEMPALNAIVKQYQNRNDVLFISLAFDSKAELKGFLAKTKFNYAVVPISEQYFEEKLKIYTFPTHLILSKKGVISKVMDNADEMILALEMELLK